MTSKSVHAGRAFTLIELVVVLFVLLLLATAVVPRAVALQRSRRLKDREGRIARLPALCRNEAVRAGVPVRLRADGSALVMERAPVGGAAEEVRREPLGAGLTLDAAQSDGRFVDAGAWQWTVYPDGSGDSGGLEFAEGASRKSLRLPSGGGARWVAGDLPDTLPERWPAGSLQPHAP